MYIAKNILKQIQQSMFSSLLLYASLFLLFFAVIIHYAEPKTFPSIWTAIYWTLVTTFTVGYGDLVPKTPFGQIIAIFCILLGTALFSRYTVLLANYVFKNQTQATKGTKVYKKNNHIIIIGWNSRTRDVLKQLTDLHYNYPIVLIDTSLEQNPPDYMLHFIKGDPTKAVTLRKANVKECKMIFITSDQNLSEIDADARTVLTLLTIKGENDTVPCIAEIMTKQHYLNAKRAGADIIIPSYTFTASSFLAVLTNNDPLSMVYLDNLFHPLGLKKIPIPKEWHSLTWQEIASLLLMKNQLLVGYIKDNKIISPLLTNHITDITEIVISQQQE